MTALLPLALMSALGFAPQQSVSLDMSSNDSTTRVIDRLPLAAAKFSIINEEKHAALLLLDKTIVLQMTDEGLRDIRREVRKETSEKPSFMGKILGSMLASGVVSMLDHGIEYSLSDLREARVENGKLVLENKSGERVFESVNINDEKVLATFSESAALRFAKRVNAARKRI